MTLHYWYINITHAGCALARVVMLAEEAQSKEFPHRIKMRNICRQLKADLSEDNLTKVCEDVGIRWCHVHVTVTNVKICSNAIKYVGNVHYE